MFINVQQRLSRGTDAAPIKTFAVDMNEVSGLRYRCQVSLSVAVQPGSLFNTLLLERFGLYNIFHCKTRALTRIAVRDIGIY